MNSRFPHNATKIFCDVWPELDDFISDYRSSGLNLSEITNANLSPLYYLLYARYGNSSIANLDENQFKYKVFAIMYQYGPTWIKRLDIQEKLRALQETDIKIGAEVINSHAYAMGDNDVLPSTDPTKIDQKSGTYYRKSKLEGYAILMDLLKSDVTGEFLDKFKPLFSKFIYTRPDIYITEEEEDEEDA